MNKVKAILEMTDWDEKIKLLSHSGLIVNYNISNIDDYIVLEDNKLYSINSSRLNRYKDYINCGLISKKPVELFKSFIEYSKGNLLINSSPFFCNVNSITFERSQIINKCDYDYYNAGMFFPATINDIIDEYKD